MLCSFFWNEEKVGECRLVGASLRQSQAERRQEAGLGDDRVRAPRTAASFGSSLKNGELLNFLMNCSAIFQEMAAVIISRISVMSL